MPLELFAPKNFETGQNGRHQTKSQSACLQIIVGLQIRHDDFYCDRERLGRHRDQVELDAGRDAGGTALIPHDEDLGIRAAR